MKNTNTKNTTGNRTAPPPPSLLKTDKAGTLLTTYPSRQQDNWISVDDKFPENGQIIIVFDLDEVEFSEYYGSKFYFVNCGATYVNVTHWQPLPKPPTK